MMMKSQNHTFHENDAKKFVSAHFSLHHHDKKVKIALYSYYFFCIRKKLNLINLHK